MAVQEQIITVIAEDLEEYNKIVDYLNKHHRINESNFDIYDNIQFLENEFKITFTLNKIRTQW